MIKMSRIRLSGIGGKPITRILLTFPVDKEQFQALHDTIDFLIKRST